MRRFALSLVLVTGLAACGAEPIWDSDEFVQAARYVHDGPPSITLVTVVNKRNGAGAHTGLIINASERVVWDPAGTFQHETIPERNDVHFGASPGMLSAYINYHTRESFDTYTQEIIVSQEVAEMAYRAVLNYGAVPKAQCSLSTTEILGALPGFESIERGWYPNKTREAFAKLPGVVEKHYVDDDSDDNSYILQQPL